MSKEEMYKEIHALPNDDKWWESYKEIRKRYGYRIFGVWLSTKDEDGNDIKLDISHDKHKWDENGRLKEEYRDDIH